MDSELYNKLKKGITHHEDGTPIRVTDAEMAQFVVESTKVKWKKSLQIFKEFVLLRHITAVTPYGAHRFIMVKPAAAKTLTTDPTPPGTKTKEGAFDWIRYELPKAPVGVEPTESPNRRQKTANADV